MAIHLIPHVFEYDNEGSQYPGDYYVESGGSGLGRSFTGIALSQKRPVRGWIFINDYNGQKWSPGGSNMSLPGSKVDGQTMAGGLIKIAGDIQVILVKQADRRAIEDAFASVTKASGYGLEHEGMAILNEPTPASCWFYWQGHGYPLMYLPSNWHSENGTPKGLSSDDICRILGQMNRSVWRVFVTDFCYSGNYFRLRFVLQIDETGAKWIETPEWSAHKDKCRDFVKAHGTPTVHFAGSTDKEAVFERGSTGGFFTQALVENWGRQLTLPHLLQTVRESVNNSLEIAKGKADWIKKDATQTPQIFSSVKLSLKDTQVLLKFQQANCRFPL